MIVFDTNALRGMNRDNPKFDVLRALKVSGLQTPAVPWMVLEELVAKQVLDYVEAYEKAESAVNQLNKKIRWRSAARVPAREIEKAKRYWRGQYDEVLVTLETSGQNAKLALAREAYCEKPAKVDPQKKGGARDVAIWLSIISYLKEHPDEEIYFVTSNVRDFGDGSEFHAPMSDDLQGMENRLSLLPSFDDVISRFTEEVTADVDSVKGLLAAHGDDSLAAIGATAQTSMKGSLFNGTRIDSESFTRGLWHDWTFRPNVILRNVFSASAHKIAESEWYTATVEWILVGFAQPFKGSFEGGITVQGTVSLPQFACLWRTKILFSTGNDQALTIVDSGPPRALNPEDEVELHPVIDKAVEANLDGVSDLFEATLPVVQAFYKQNPSLWKENTGITFGETSYG